MLDALRAELIGPAPVGEPVDSSQPIKFGTAAEAYPLRYDANSGEEILQRDPPSRRYGIGVLFPVGVEDREEEIPDSSVIAPRDSDDGPPVLADSARADLETVRAREQNTEDEEDSDTELDLSGANTYKPTTMAVTFLAEVKTDTSINVVVSAGRYERKKIEVGTKEWTWWIRRPLQFTATFSGRELLGKRIARAERVADDRDFQGLDIRVELYSRPHGSDKRLLTVCLVNRTPAAPPADERMIFQAGFTVTATLDDQPAVLPYPGPPSETLDDEEQGLDLLYRRVQTFAVGHGCAADWELVKESERIRTVIASSLPLFETPSVTSEARRPDSVDPLAVYMRPLAGLVPGDDGFDALDNVVSSYEQWIEDRRVEADALPERYQRAAHTHVDACRRAAERMRDGILFLKESPLALRAFRLANHAILIQQVNGARAPRAVTLEAITRRLMLAPEYSPPNCDNLGPNEGQWRAFQIAFILMTLRAVSEGQSPDRLVVDLIWFPTGGGKTEAYLGLAAYAMFFRRLSDPRDAGTSVLMRYTLRLLTAQQFQRACRLICAMEWLRKRDGDLGAASFSIGIWLGRAITPNKRQAALELLRKLQKDDRAENKFLLDRCPWCRSPMGVVSRSGTGPARRSGRSSKGEPQHLVLGYQQRGNTVVFVCPDARCPFGADTGLPVFVIDEDIYEQRPSVLIGTVDKFAMLAWNDAARGIFGIGPDGTRVCSPPELIIQDELHLISGPLCSMVGLYEALIEELCTDRRGRLSVPPKIVCSTATIRRYREQVEALYHREKVELFPPPGIDVNDSFFARAACEADGSLSPGRLYVGVHGPGLGSLQTVQVRALAALLQAPQPFTLDDRDPWWTLLIFFNSLRELGGTLSLIQSDIPDHLRVLKNRYGFDWSDMRQLRHVEELTSRLKSQEVPEAITKLETTTTDRGAAVDICLASNIIEVGIDIDRLSLMAVVGQPKTTAQYIQVTGRIGRRWTERPGLVVTIYSATKARDRSHFEKFRSYHERLYAQVEPTSVTPFSRPVLERALHAIMVGYVRQTAPTSAIRTPQPYPAQFMARLRDLVIRRVRATDKEEVLTVEAIFARREREWQAWSPRVWSANDGEDALMRAAGDYADPLLAIRSWQTPMSLRNVDAECQGEITALYDAAVASVLLAEITVKSPS